MKPFTLYKRTETGKIQTWTITLEGSCFYTTIGQLGGKLTTSKPTVCKPKSVGKSNATTAETQARREVFSKIREKLKEQYSHTPEQAANRVHWFGAKAAEEYSKYPLKDDDFPVFSQPKMDGMRSTIDITGMWSREHEPVLSAPHIWAIFEPLFKLFPDLVIDGELYNHDYKDDFDSLMSLARTNKLTPAQVKESTEKLQFHVFDAEDSRHRDFAGRQLTIDSIIRGIHPSIHIVETIKAPNQKVLDLAYAKYQKQGYEGQMIIKNKQYQQKRSSDLLKRKEFTDLELPIQAFEEGEGNRAGTAGKAVFIFTNGKEFKAGIKGNMAYFKELWENQGAYLGRPATVKYQNLTPKGVPRFAVMMEIRDKL